MLHQGKLKGWDPVKGSGFIQQDKAGPDIRIGTGSFRKKPEKLQNGDRIFFQIEVDPQGKPKAVFAYRAGQQFKPAEAFKRPASSTPAFQQLLSGLITLSILGWLGYQSVQLFHAKTTFPVQTSTEYPENFELHKDDSVLESPVWPPIQTLQSVQFQCEGKQHCSEMDSCDEAKFYLENCPNVLIDGDRDGIPCERQLCM